MLPRDVLVLPPTGLLKALSIHHLRETSHLLGDVPLGLLEQQCDCQSSIGSDLSLPSHFFCSTNTGAQIRRLRFSIQRCGKDTLSARMIKVTPIGTRGLRISDDELRRYIAENSTER